MNGPIQTIWFLHDNTPWVLTQEYKKNIVTVARRKKYYGMVTFWVSLIILYKI